MKNTKLIPLCTLCSISFTTVAALDQGIDTTLSSMERLGPQTGYEKFAQDQQSQLGAAIPELKKDEDSKDLDAEKLPKFELKEITLEGNNIFTTDALKKYWVDALNQKVNLLDLKKIAKAITKFYRTQGYMLSYAMVPAQTLKDGKVKLQVVEGYINKVNVVFEDKKQYLSQRIARLVRKIQQEKPTTQSAFERYILLIRDLYPYSKGYLEPAEDKADGAADLNVVVPKQGFVDGNVSTNNYAKDSIGPWTFSAQVKTPAFWNREHKMHATYYQGTYASEMKSASLGYTFPIGSEGTTLGIDGLVIRSQPVGSLTDFEVVTREDRASFTLMHPFIRSIETNLYFGTEFITQNQSRLVKFSDDITKERSRNLKLVMVANILDDRLGGSNYSRLAYVKGLRVMGSAGLGYVNRTRTRGSADHSYIEGRYTRLQKLWGPFSLGLYFDGQYAMATLSDINRYRSNGMPFNGAYPGGSLSGDSGLESKLELNYTTYGVPKLKYVRTFVYASKAKVWNRHPRATEHSSESAKGLGAGIEVMSNNDLTASLQYGYPLDNPLSGNERVKPNVGFSLNWKF